MLKKNIGYGPCTSRLLPVWGNNQVWVYDIDEMKQHVLNLLYDIDHSIIDCAIDERCGHFRACMQIN